MPLSEHEERILAEIERQLAEEDPGFVARARRASGTVGRSLKLAIAGFVLGILCVLGLTFHFAFGVVGFVLLLVSTVIGVTAVRRRQAQRPQARNDSR